MASYDEDEDMLQHQQFDDVNHEDAAAAGGGSSEALAQHQQPLLPEPDDPDAVDEDGGADAAERRGKRWIDVQVDGSRVSAEQAAAVSVVDREVSGCRTRSRECTIRLRMKLFFITRARQETFSRELYVATVCALKILQHYESIDPAV